MTKIKQIQGVENEILKEVVGTLNQIGIDYTLAYGTFLGAVRHEGFIPWDDDIDIYVLDKDIKKNMKKIIRLLKTNYFFQCPKTEIISPWIFYKVRKNGTYMHEAALDSRYDNINQGIWMDLFPLVNASKYSCVVDIQLYLIYRLQKLRFNFFDSKKSLNIKKKTYNVFLGYIYSFIDNIIAFLGSEKSNFYIIKNTNYYSKSYIENRAKSMIPKNYFNDKKLYKFEDYNYFGPKDYDGYLKYFYGNDYMIPKKYSHPSNYDDVKF